MESPTGQIAVLALVEYSAWLENFSTNKSRAQAEARERAGSALALARTALLYDKQADREITDLLQAIATSYALVALEKEFDPELLLGEEELEELLDESTRIYLRKTGHKLIEENRS